MRSDEDLLRDIVEAAASIRRRAGSSRADFDADEMLRVWCLHHLTIIGEAAARVSPDLRSRNRQVPWRELAGMRNALVHGYSSVDWDEVWSAVEHDVGTVAAAVEEILAETKQP